jgi:hypothetical protein
MGARIYTSEIIFQLFDLYTCARSDSIVPQRDSSISVSPLIGKESELTNCIFSRTDVLRPFLRCLTDFLQCSPLTTDRGCVEDQPQRAITCERVWISYALFENDALRLGSAIAAILEVLPNYRNTQRSLPNLTPMR